MKRFSVLTVMVSFAMAAACGSSTTSGGDTAGDAQAPTSSGGDPTAICTSACTKKGYASGSMLPPSGDRIFCGCSGGAGTSFSDADCTSLCTELGKASRASPLNTNGDPATYEGCKCQ